MEASTIVLWARSETGSSRLDRVNEAEILCWRGNSDEGSRDEKHQSWRDIALGSRNYDEKKWRIGPVVEGAKKP